MHFTPIKHDHPLLYPGTTAHLPRYRAPHSPMLATIAEDPSEEESELLSVTSNNIETIDESHTLCWCCFDFRWDAVVSVTIPVWIQQPVGCVVCMLMFLVALISKRDPTTRSRYWLRIGETRPSSSYSADGVEIDECNYRISLFWSFQILRRSWKCVVTRMNKKQTVIYIVSDYPIPEHTDSHHTRTLLYLEEKSSEYLTDYEWFRDYGSDVEWWYFTYGDSESDDDCNDDDCNYCRDRRQCVYPRGHDVYPCDISVPCGQARSSYE